MRRGSWRKCERWISRIGVWTSACVRCSRSWPRIRRPVFQQLAEVGLKWRPPTACSITTTSRSTIFFNRTRQRRGGEWQDRRSLFWRRYDRDRFDAARAASGRGGTVDGGQSRGSTVARAPRVYSRRHTAGNCACDGLDARGCPATAADTHACATSRDTAGRQGKLPLGCRLAAGSRGSRAPAQCADGVRGGQRGGHLRADGRGDERAANCRVDRAGVPEPGPAHRKRRRRRGPRVSSPAASGSASVVHQNHQCPWP